MCSSVGLLSEVAKNLYSKFINNSKISEVFPLHPTPLDYFKHVQAGLNL